MVDLEVVEVVGVVAKVVVVADRPVSEVKVAALSFQHPFLSWFPSCWQLLVTSRDLLV